MVRCLLCYGSRMAKGETGTKSAGLGVKRTVVVPKEYQKTFLDACVRTLFELSWNEARDAIKTGKVSSEGEPLMDALKFVRPGMNLELNPNARKRRPDVDLPPKALVHVDAHVVVVEKPSGISTVPFDETETGTLDMRVKTVLAKKAGGSPNLGIVHRIDKETSGLVVFTRTWLAKQSLSSQFRAHTVHRKYLAIAHGHVQSQTIRTHLLEDRGDGLRGSFERTKRTGAPTGALSVTHIELLQHLEGASLVACRLETGKTHQIRIHLSEMGHPILGERVYIRNFKGDEIPAPRVMLHAAELGFVHPKTEADVRWESPMPADMRETLARLAVADDA
jgi:23S rRNA pseudouridine1911/1915/1917 synthase